MNTKLNERGQALILIVFAAIALFGFAALAIDGSRVFSDRRHAQNAADTAVLAAALAEVRGGDYVNAAVKRAESNGFTSTNSTIEVLRCNDPNLTVPCEGLPADADESQYIQVVIRTSTPTTFARILGRTEVGSVVSAIARAVGGTSPSGTPSAAVSAFNLHAPHAVHGNGNFSLNIMRSGIFNNSDATSGCPAQPQENALWFHGSGTYAADDGYSVVGTHCAESSVDVTGDFKPATQVPTPLLDIPVPTISCPPGNVSKEWAGTHWRIPPGEHYADEVPGGTVVFLAGDHCFPQGYRMTGNSNISVEANSQFLISGGTFDMSANGSFTCNGLLVHINGGLGMHFNGNGIFRCDGITFYASTGDVRWNGTVENDFTAPVGGTYHGLLLYLPNGNTNQITVSGNASSQFTGSIIAISSPILLQGNNATLALSTKIMADTVEFSGNGNFVIDYDPSKQFALGEPTMIQLTK